jgi:single-strand DNA-binding protein
MNHVNLIGKLCSAPKFRIAEDGRKIANFTMSTHEVYLERKRRSAKSHWHRLTAWGNDLKALEELGERGRQMAVEGKLSTRFYKDKSGQRISSSEVLVNSLSFI